MQGGNEAKGEGETQRHRTSLSLIPCAARVMMMMMIIIIIIISLRSLCRYLLNIPVHNCSVQPIWEEHTYVDTDEHLV